jgi:hypothetical protein
MIHASDSGRARLRSVSWLMMAGLFAPCLLLGTACVRVSGDDLKDDYSAPGLSAQAEAALAAGHPGYAILEYERARWMAPGSRVIENDLARARAAAHLSPSEPGLAGSARQLVRVDRWGWVALTGVGLSAAGAVLMGRRSVSKLEGVIMLLAGSSLAGLALWVAIGSGPPANLGVVVGRDVVARAGPSAQSLATFAVPEGALITVERARGDYALVGSGAQRGWVPRAWVETVLPQNARP